MKKSFVIFCSLFISFSSIAANSPIKKSELKASGIFIPLGKGDKKISLLELSVISRTDLEKLTGKKMNLPQRFAFKGVQKKLQHGINGNGVVTDKKLKKMFYAGNETGFHLGGFALGFLASLIGVLIAYLINDDLKRNRVKWAWIGFAAALVLSLIITVSIL